MSKLPYMQFYVHDWLCDPALKTVSFTTKGIWIDLLCYLWESKTRGKLTGKIDFFMKLLSCNINDFNTFLSDNKAMHFASVTECNKIVTVSNRRMVKEEKARNDTYLRVKKYREKQTVTPLKQFCNALDTDTDTDTDTNTDTKEIKNKIEKKENLIREKKEKFGEFQNVFLSTEEIKKLTEKFGGAITKEKIENLSQGIASKNYKYKSHYATILSWDRKNNAASYNMPKLKPGFSKVTEHNLEIVKSIIEKESQNGKEDVVHPALSSWRNIPTKPILGSS